MAQYVIHKKGFFYTDESFEEEKGLLGKIVKIFDNMEEAKAAKIEADIKSLQKLKDNNAVDFFFHAENYDAVYQQMEDYYKSEFNQTIKDKYYFDFPSKISKDQAQKLLEILQLSFHDIVEYGDEITLNPKDFKLDEEELCQF
jgi:hypothetical protein